VFPIDIGPEGIAVESLDSLEGSFGLFVVISVRGTGLGAQWKEWLTIHHENTFNCCH
jgi:hypothetical protein